MVICGVESSVEVPSYDDVLVSRGGCSEQSTEVGLDLGSKCCVPWCDVGANNEDAPSMYGGGELNAGQVSLQVRWDM